MKASISADSLTALNPDEENQIQQQDFLTCFICLEEMNDKQEPLVPSSMLRTCGCVFQVHPECWNAWMVGKTDFDCPICRKKSLTLNKPPTPPIPVEAYPQITERNYRKYFCYGFIMAIVIVISVFIILQMASKG